MGFILEMEIITAVNHAGKIKGRKILKKKKAKPSNELAGWLFYVLYWLDATRVPKAKWKYSAFEKYKLQGLSKKYPKGTFKKTWKFIKKKGLIREGNKKIMRKRRKL